MKEFRTALFALAAVWLVGCETTGGTLGGLLPTPKFLKGEIRNDIYTAQDKSFSVRVPHKDGSYEYKYMQVKEQYGDLGAYVSFGPAAFDQSIYRIETAKRTSQSKELDKAASAKIVEGYKAQLQKAFGTAPKEVSSSQETINGRKAFYWQLTQIIPAGKYLNNKEATFAHDVYVMDLEKGAAIVWIQMPETTKKPAIEARVFAESVVMY